MDEAVDAVYFGAGSEVSFSSFFASCLSLLNLSHLSNIFICYQELRVKIRSERSHRLLLLVLLQRTPGG